MGQQTRGRFMLSRPDAGASLIQLIIPHPMLPTTTTTTTVRPTYQNAHLSARLPTCPPPASLPTHLPASLPAHPPTCLFTHLPTNLSTNLPAHLLTHLPKHSATPPTPFLRHFHTSKPHPYPPQHPPTHRYTHLPTTTPTYPPSHPFIHSPSPSPTHCLSGRG